MKTIQFREYTCAIQFAKYSNGRTAIQLIDMEDGIPVVTASVNIPEAHLEEYEITLKGWSENMGVPEALVAAGVVGPELRRVPAGFVKASVHKLLIDPDTYE